jgi:hypothetical protein
MHAHTYSHTYSLPFPFLTSFQFDEHLDRQIKLFADVPEHTNANAPDKNGVQYFF